jgi:hypothetical protein
MQANFSLAERMQDGGQFTIFSFPSNSHLFERRGELASGDKMPAPVIEASHIPTVFEAVVQQENFAQKVADAKKIVGVCERTQGKFHVVALASSVGFRRRTSDFLDLSLVVLPLW